MPEQDKRSFMERLLQGIFQQTFANVKKAARNFVRHIIRVIALALAGAAIAVLGTAFIAVGVVKGLTVSALMPNWLAWLVVGIVLFLVGVTLTFAARS